MSPRPLFPAHLAALVPYVPGKPITETEREYGVTNIAKLASNENCLGASPKAVEAMQHALAQTHVYPDAGGFYLKERIAKLHGRHAVSPAQIVLGNGTNELIMLLARALLDAKEGDAMLNAWPSFICYRIAARAIGCAEIAVPLDATLGYDLDAMAAAAEANPNIKLVFLANPNNPTGRMFTSSQLDAFFARIASDVVVVLDEAYAEYVRDPQYPDGVSWVQKRPRTVVLRTFSKVYGLASLRVGYAICDRGIADLLNKLRDAFNTSHLAQAAALAALDDDEHVKRSLAHNAKELPRLVKGLEDRGFDVTPSQGNFVLATIPAESGLPDVAGLNEALLRRGVIVRPVANYDLPRSVRISVGTAAENDKLFAALDALFQAPTTRVAPAVVVALDGPAGAGKSTVARLVAEKAGLALVDTGAIYRSVALEALRRKVSVDDGEGLAKIAIELARNLRFEMIDGKNRVFLGRGNGSGEEDVSEAIRTPEVSAAASSVSRHAEVRGALLDLQRALGRRHPGAVLEGRDIGTVVFPDARVKAFVTASPAERAKRRMKELADKGMTEPFEKVLAEIEARDKQDSERAVAPLKPAKDAVLVDTTGKPLDSVVDEVLALVKRAMTAPSA
jgi:histidinol-phosphate aminotransferase